MTFSPPPHPVVAKVLDAFAKSGRSLAPETLAAFAQCARQPAALECAIAAAAQDGAWSRLDDLLACRGAVEEMRDPARLARRLRREAADLDVRAERDEGEAAEDFGRAAYRSGQGQDGLAQTFRIRAEAAERCAVRRREDAMSKRLQAAEIESGQALARGLMDVAGG